MKLFLVVLFLIGGMSATFAQATEPLKFEVSFVLPLLLNQEAGQTTRLGTGQRFTFNLTSALALEAESLQFRGCSLTGSNRCTGKMYQGLFGLKLSHKFNRVGVFGKVRPGLAMNTTYSLGPFLPSTPNPTTPYILGVSFLGRTNPALDIGGGMEFNHTRRLFTRIDVGDTIIWHRQSSMTTVLSNNRIETGVVAPKTAHNLQVTVSLGLRF